MPKPKAKSAEEGSQHSHREGRHRHRHRHTESTPASEGAPPVPPLPLAGHFSDRAATPEVKSDEYSVRRSQSATTTPRPTEGSNTQVMARRDSIHPIRRSVSSHRSMREEGDGIEEARKSGQSMSLVPEQAFSLKSIEDPLVRALYAARAELMQKLADRLRVNANSTDIQDAALCDAAYAILHETMLIANHPSKKPIPISELTGVLQSVRLIIDGPLPSDVTRTIYNTNLKDFSEKSAALRRFPIAKALATAMSFLIGTAVVVACGVIALASWGVLAPIAALGLVFGASMVTAGLSTAGAVLGVGAIGYGGHSLFNLKQKQPLCSEMGVLHGLAQQKYLPR